MNIVIYAVSGLLLDIAEISDDLAAALAALCDYQQSGQSLV